MPAYYDTVGDVAGLPWQATPLVLSTVIPANTVTRFAPADPMRTVLLISSNGTTFVGVQPSPTFATSGGIAFGTTIARLELFQQLHGLLVAQAWYALTPNIGVVMTIVATSLTRWSGQPGEPTMLERADNGEFRGQNARTAYRIGRSKQYGNRWRQSQALSPYGLPANGDNGVRVVDGAGGVGAGDAGGNDNAAADFWKRLPRWGVY